MSYLVTIELRGIDRMGILLDLAKVVSADFSINIREVGIHSHDGIFEGSISLYVKDAEGLQDVMTRLQQDKRYRECQTNFKLRYGRLFNRNMGRGDFRSHAVQRDLAGTQEGEKAGSRDRKAHSARSLALMGHAICG